MDIQELIELQSNYSRIKHEIAHLVAQRETHENCYFSVNNSEENLRVSVKRVILLLEDEASKIENIFDKHAIELKDR